MILRLRTSSSSSSSNHRRMMMTSLFYLATMPAFLLSWSPSILNKRCMSYHPHGRFKIRSSSSSSSPSPFNPLLLRRQDSLDGHKDKVYHIHNQYDGTHCDDVTRMIHNKKQAEVFDENSRFFAGEEATPPEVVPRLDTIIKAGLVNKESKVLDVGTGVGVLIPFLEKQGVARANITGVDVSPGMLEVAKRRYPTSDFWEGDIIDYPTSEAGKGKAFDAIYFNACFGNIWDQTKALEEVGEITARDGRVVISHPLGAAFVDELKRRSPSVVLTSLPTSMQQLQEVAQFSRLKPESLVNDKELYIALYRRQPHRPLRQALYLRGKVAKGYGRGSKKLGVPTANLPESLFSETLRDLPTGVYLGWASVSTGGGEERKTCKAVVNVGYSPTFVGEENREKIVEAHLIDADFGGDFYDQEMRLLLAGYQRPEMKFPSFPDLVKAIHQDVDDARQALDLPVYQTSGLLALLTDDETKSRWLPFEEWK